MVCGIVVVFLPSSKKATIKIIITSSSYYGISLLFVGYILIHSPVTLTTPFFFRVFIIGVAASFGVAFFY